MDLIIRQRQLIEPPPHIRYKETLFALLPPFLPLLALASELELP
jgi:hypothetical protein